MKSYYRNVVACIDITFCFILLIICMVANAENILNGNGFFGDTVDTAKKGVEKHR